MTLAMNYANEVSADLLAGMFDIAVNHYCMEGDMFWNCFLISRIAKQFEDCNPKYILGKSSVEIVSEILERTGIIRPMDNEYISFDRTPEYWSGWVLSQYQTHSCLSYKRIHDLVSFQELTAIYHPYHEAPVEKVLDLLDSRLPKTSEGLKLQREQMGLSQSALSKLSGTNIKTLQAYEQGLKNLSHAKAETLSRLSSVLACEMHDLL